MDQYAQRGPAPGPAGCRCKASRGGGGRAPPPGQRKAPEKACKPGPVSRPRLPEAGETVISLGRRLPGASSGHTREPHAGHASPVRRANATPGSLSYLALLRVGFTEPARSPAPLVSSYLTVSPLPRGSRRVAVCFLWH